METFKKLKENSKEFTHLKISLAYDKGGAVGYHNTPRGYYLTVTPIAIESRNGYTVEKMHAFSGYRSCVHEVKRCSAKAMKQAEENAAAVAPSMIRAVLEENKLELAKNEEL